MVLMIHGLFPQNEFCKPGRVMVYIFHRGEAEPQKQPCLVQSVSWALGREARCSRLAPNILSTQPY